MVSNCNRSEIETWTRLQHRTPGPIVLEELKGKRREEKIGNPMGRPIQILKPLSAQMPIYHYPFPKLTIFNFALSLISLSQTPNHIETQLIEMATPMVEDSFEDDQLAPMTTEDITRASRLLDNEIRILKVWVRDWIWIFVWNLIFALIWGTSDLSYCFWQEELQRTNLELDSFREKIKENQEKIKLNKQLPYLVGNIVEV